jgi:hypothetical protein
MPRARIVPLPVFHVMSVCLSPCPPPRSQRQCGRVNPLPLEAVAASLAASLPQQQQQQHLALFPWFLDRLLPCPHLFASPPPNHLRAQEPASMWAHQPHTS